MSHLFHPESTLQGVFLDWPKETRREQDSLLWSQVCSCVFIPNTFGKVKMSVGNTVYRHCS